MLFTVLMTCYRFRNVIKIGKPLELVEVIAVDWHFRERPRMPELNTYGLYIL